MKRLIGLLFLAGGIAAVLPDARSAAAPEPLVVEFLDVGQGDATLIRTPDGKVALIDTGPPPGALKHLEERGVKSVDLLVTSHHHLDHMGGSAVIVEEYEPRAYLDSGSGHTSKAYRGLLQALRDSPKTKILRPREVERKIRLGASVVVRVFPQPPEDEDNENNNSVGLRVEYGDFSALLTGDSEDDERAWWMENADKSLYSNVKVLKLAHHGSHNGTDPAWLKAAAPEVAIASCGRNNRYGHPHRKTLDLLGKQMVRLKRTDEEGTITVKSNGATWDFAQAGGARRTYPGSPASADLFGRAPVTPTGLGW